MAKKKISIKSVSTDVESGDVNISYKNVRIAGLSESTTAVLETKDSICEDDIEVEFTKPSSGVSLAEVNITNTPGALITPNVGEIIYEKNGNIKVNTDGGYEKLYVVPHFDNRANAYDFTILVESLSDSLNVNFNGTAVEFSAKQGGYACEYVSATYPEEITIVITNKV